ncbi:pentapeptide repeat-containing protein [Pseudomonas alkylphenolica]|uniref:pentapeptide repeat-containing protein n=1 Tax=Pseudomonas alkylphenolica TaxID=237609 RepID=UPI0012FD89CD|nr:pentapeptide repeat-containing protein [Pseudomonas alkylphenolica]
MSIFDSQIKTSITIITIGLIVIFGITACWDAISSNVLPDTTLGLYSRGFWENYLVELHGMVLELAVVGGLILWLDSRRTGRSEIKRQLEDLSDYALLDAPEINLKKIGILKRLNDARVTNFNVANLSVFGMLLNNFEARNGKLIGLKVEQGVLKNVLFDGVMMRSSNFEGCEIKNSRFVGSNLLKSKFKGAVCRGASFERTILERCDFTDCDLQSANFKGADMRGVKFDGANLKQCSLMGAKNLDLNALAKASCLDYVAISDAELKILIGLRNDMKYQKSKGRP